MTKRKLLELYTKLKQKEITVEVIEKLKELTDDEIDIVLKSTNKKEVIELIKNESFRKLPKEIKQELINIINNCHELSGSLSHILKVATDKNAISSNQVVELCKTISKSKGILQSYKASLVACNINAITSGKVLQLVELISNCSNEENANVAYFAAINQYIIRSGRVDEIVKLITDSEDKETALKIYYESLNISKDINLSDALSNGHINGIDFWSTFIENADEAITLLDMLEVEEISSNLIICREKSKTNRR